MKGDVMKTLLKALLIATVIIVILRLAGVIAWSWAQALSLLWIPILVVIGVILACIAIYLIAVVIDKVCIRIKRRGKDA